MDSIKGQKLHPLSKFKGSHPLKGPFPILLSISVFFSFFVSYPSSWAPTTTIKSLKPFLAAVISNHLSFEVDRKLLFLLCNAILVFVTSGFGFFGVSTNAVEDLHGEYLARSAAYHGSVPFEDKEVIVESIVLVESGVTDKEVIITDIQEEDDATDAAAAPADKENHYQQHHLYQPAYHHQRSHPYDLQHHSQLHGLQEEEEEEDTQEKYEQQQEQDERFGLVIIEESDKRFDDFIKQVKEGMRMEAKQMLLTA